MKFEVEGSATFEVGDDTAQAVVFQAMNNLFMAWQQAMAYASQAGAGVEERKPATEPAPRGGGPGLPWFTPNDGLLTAKGLFAVRYTQSPKANVYFVENPNAVACFAFHPLPQYDNQVKA